MSDIITVKLTDVWSKYLSGIWDLLVTAYTDYFVAFLSLTVAYFTEDWVGIIIAQTVGFIGMFLSIISFQSKSYQKIIWIRVASEFVFALQYFLLGLVVSGWDVEISSRELTLVVSIPELDHRHDDAADVGERLVA